MQRTDGYVATIVSGVPVIATAKRPARCLADWCAARKQHRPNVAFRGQSLRRLEDERFLTGRGPYIEDIDDPGQPWMHVVRSPHAHAAIGRIDAEAARAGPACTACSRRPISPTSGRCRARRRSPASSR